MAQSVLLRRGDAVPKGMDNFEGILPTKNVLCGAYSDTGINFATKDRFVLNLLLLITVKSDRI